MSTTTAVLSNPESNLNSQAALKTQLLERMNNTLNGIAEQIATHVAVLKATRSTK